MTSEQLKNSILSMAKHLGGLQKPYTEIIKNSGIDKAVEMVILLMFEKNYNPLINKYQYNDYTNIYNYYSFLKANGYFEFDENDYDDNNTKKVNFKTVRAKDKYEQLKQLSEFYEVRGKHSNKQFIDDIIKVTENNSIELDNWCNERFSERADWHLNYHQYLVDKRYTTPYI